MKKKIQIVKKEKFDVKSKEKKLKVDEIKLHLLLDSEEEDLGPYSILSLEDTIKLEKIEKELLLLRPSFSSTTTNFNSTINSIENKIINNFDNDNKDDNNDNNNLFYDFNKLHDYQDESEDLFNSEKIKKSASEGYLAEQVSKILYFYFLILFI